MHSRFHLESPLGSIIRVLEDLDDPRKAPQRIYKGRVGWGIPNFAIRSLDPRDCSMALWPRSTSRLIAHPSSELTCHGPCHDRGLSRAFCQSSSFLRPRIRKSSVTSRIEPQTQQPAPQTTGAHGRPERKAELEELLATRSPAPLGAPHGIGLSHKSRQTASLHSRSSDRYVPDLCRARPVCSCMESMTHRSPIL